MSANNSNNALLHSPGQLAPPNFVAVTRLLAQRRPQVQLRRKVWWVKVGSEGGKYECIGSKCGLAAELFWQ